MKEKNDPSIETEKKAVVINKLRKTLADKMVALFGEYELDKGTYSFTTTLTEIGKKLGGFDKAHMSRALSPQNPLPTNQYKTLIRVVDALVIQKNELEKKIENLKKETQFNEETIEQEGDTEAAKQEGEIENYKREISKQKEKIQELSAAKKAITDRSKIEGLIGLMLLITFTILMLTYYRNDIIRNVDSYKAIRNFNNASEELIFYNGKIESRSIDTSDIREFLDLENDTIVLNKKGIKILKLKTTSSLSNIPSILGKHSIILDPSFEAKKIGDYRDNWKNKNLGGLFQSTKTLVYDGEIAAKLPASGDRIGYQQINVLRNKDYILSFHYTMRQNKKGSLKVSILKGKIFSIDEIEKATIESITLQDQSDEKKYKKASLTFNSGDNSIVSIYFSNEGVQCRLDDFNLEILNENK